MTNWEKYKDNIIIIIADSLAVDKSTKQPIDCDDIICKECEFFTDGCTRKNKLNWLNAEYIEPPKDTLEVATLIAFLKQEPNQIKHVKSINIVDGMPVINGGD